MLEDPEVACAVGQVRATSERTGHLETKCIPPEPQRPLKVGCPHPYMSQPSSHRLEVPSGLPEVVR
jgi:hypothetical protein